MKTIELDGAAGGGQILRTALSLSMITGRPFRIANIRGGRPRPGLMRQHLAAVRAAAQVCGAQVQGAELGSIALAFVPGTVCAGDYEFAIGSAGSCTLLLQTLLPALLQADGPSTVRVTGGTHNPLAPPVHFLQRSFLPLLARMGAAVTLELKRFGFSPAGGGVAHMAVSPCERLLPLDLVERGEPLQAYAEAFVAALRGSVAQRELEVVRDVLGWQPDQLHVRGLPADQGPGNALLLTFEDTHATHVFTAFGARFVSAEEVAREVLAAAARHRACAAAVDEHLADQLMLPLALAGGGSFSCPAATDHIATNAETIASFLPVRFAIAAESGLCRVTVLPA